MPLRRKGSKVDLLKTISPEFLRIVFKISLVLVFLNAISVLLTYYNKEVFPVAIITLIISLVPCIGSYIILKINSRS